MPSLCLYFITNFFIGPHLLFFFPYNLFTIQSSTLPSHHSTKAVQAKVTKKLTGQILWPLLVLIFLHLSTQLYIMNTSPQSFFFPDCCGTMPSSLQSCCPFTSSFSAHLLGAGALQGTILSVRSPLSSFFTLPYSVSSVVIHLPRTPICGRFSPSSPALQTSAPSLFIGLLHFDFPDWLVFFNGR